MPSLPAELKDTFERFTEGPTFVNEVIAGIAPAGLNRPGTEGWSIRDVLIHLADTEMVRAIRFRTILAEDEPTLAVMDEEQWKRRLHYLWRSPEAAISLFQQLRYTNAELLAQCDRQSWQRTATHPELGTVTLSDLLRRGVDHVDEHVAQVHELRSPASR